MQQQQRRQHCDCDSRRQARCVVQHQEAACSNTSAPTNTQVGGGSARGWSCCRYDAMATAPWEASEELNELSPQLKWSGRQQPGHRQRSGTDSAETQAGPPVPTALHGNAQPGVSASLAASRVMTLGEIPHTSVRRCSEKGEAPTPCLPSLVETKWERAVAPTFFISGGIVLLTGYRVDLAVLRIGPPWQNEPQPGF